MKNEKRYHEGGFTGNQTLHENIIALRKAVEEIGTLRNKAKKHTVMEKYKVVQLCDGITQPQAEQVAKFLNDGYFILSEYKFTNHVILILQLEENEGLNCDDNGKL